VKDTLPVILEIASIIAQLDVIQSFSYAATVRGYVKPVLHDGTALEIVAGRHPVVEAHLPPGAFVPNSLEVDSSGVSFALVTGPNMAGKSTVLRQAALIVLLAHAGSFVPAEEARIGAVDRIFCRVGASDNLARGESTFLVEMNETAHILRYATASSLVIMDEVGRGTGTSDGLAIARAVCEYLLNRIRARTLFATHYLELTRIVHDRLINLSMTVEEVGDHVVFPKTLVRGAAEASYGIHVAALAGLPPDVVHRARDLLRAPGGGDPSGTNTDTPSAPSRETEASIARVSKIETDGYPSSRSQPSLFDASEMVMDELLSLDLSNLTPLESINLLARWQKEVSEG
jgi:DNA mismatch repair protein MutS